MRWVLDVCPNSLDWQTWLMLCAIVVVLWAAAIAGATALFHASGQGRAERREAREEPSPTRTHQTPASSQPKLRQTTNGRKSPT